MARGTIAGRLIDDRPDLRGWRAVTSITTVGWWSAVVLLIGIRHWTLLALDYKNEILVESRWFISRALLIFPLRENESFWPPYRALFFLLHDDVKHGHIDGK